LVEEDQLTGRRKFIFSIGIVIFLALIPLLTKRNDLINLMVLIFLYICLAQSWNIIGGYTGQVSLGHAAFFGLGAITTRFLWIWGTPFLLAFLTGGFVAVVFSLIIGHPALRLRGIYFAIGTLGLAQIYVLTLVRDSPTIFTNKRAMQADCRRLRLSPSIRRFQRYVEGKLVCLKK
jgi:ABC-type branched-subunit amino acid transport system permease subunit